MKTLKSILVVIALILTTTIIQALEILDKYEKNSCRRCSLPTVDLSSSLLLADKNNVNCEVKNTSPGAFIPVFSYYLKILLMVKSG